MRVSERDRERESEREVMYVAEEKKTLNAPEKESGERNSDGTDYEYGFY